MIKEASKAVPPALVHIPANESNMALRPTSFSKKAGKAMSIDRC